MSLLSLIPVPPDSLPSSADSAHYTQYRSAVVASAVGLISSLHPHTAAVWSKGKTLNQKQGVPTDTYSSVQPPPGTGDCEGFRWHARQSRHDPRKISYEQFEAGLLRNHSSNEREYIDSCFVVRQLAVAEEGELEVWQTKYNSPFPASRRAFVFRILTVSLPSRPSPTDPSRTLRSFIVVSIPTTHPDAPEEKEFVRGRYVSVEEVREDDDGTLVWTMAVSSDPGGSIPRFLSERVMPAKISEDVPSFLWWVWKGPLASLNPHAA
ncbi:hypothetical protein JCM10450v2_002491 [Rhodotorula kratochvilovae]